MNELVKVSKATIGQEKVNSVDARELWDYLESKQEFSNWIKKKLEKCKFQDGRDFIVFDNFIKNSNGRPRKEFILTLDAAKHIAMLEGNDKGFEVREYFIEVEKKYNEPQKVLPERESEIRLRDAKAVLELVELYNQTFGLDNHSKMLFAQNELHKYNLPVPHVPLLEVTRDNNFTLERTAIYAKFGTNPHRELGRKIKAILDKYKGDPKFSKAFHYEKQGHSGIYYKYCPEILDEIRRELA